MAWSSLIAAAVGSGPTNPATASFNSSGGDFVAFTASIYNAIYTPPLLSGDVTDNKSNTYTLLTVQSQGINTTGIWYAKNATCGSGHVVTLNRTSVYAGVVAGAWSGSDTSAPFRDENGAVTASATSLATGNAGANTDLLIASLGVSTTEADSATEANGFSMAARVAYGAANNESAQLWYLVASGANQANFSFSSSYAVALIGSFKAAAGGGATNWGPWVVGGMSWNRLVQGR